MHLIFALSLWESTLGAKHGVDLQLPDSTKWKTWIYEHKHTEQDAANAALRIAGQTKNTDANPLGFLAWSFDERRWITRLVDGDDVHGPTTALKTAP